MEPEVVVVGAGPVGLWLAAPHSKALGIHPRTVEVLAMRGAEKEFLDHGRPMPSWHFAMLPTRLDFSALDTPYPFMLAYPQARTEEHSSTGKAGSCWPATPRTCTTRPAASA